MELDSSHLQSADWDEGRMTVSFRKGGVYEYYDVPFGTYQELLAAASASEYFRQNVKGVFEFVKVA